MIHSARLKFDIRTYWHAGTGRGRGGTVDAVTYKDADGLPRLPGRTVKGLVRDAVAQAEELNWFAEDGELKDLSPGITDRLFGKASEEQGKSEPGGLRFSDAVLPEDVRRWFRGNPKERGLISGLYRTHFATAVNDKGSAVDQTLRGIEVTVPVTLYATVSLVPDAGDLGPWTKVLERALPLIHAVGAHRTRGFGRVCVSLELDP